jgi:hypothetical protein
LGYRRSKNRPSSIKTPQGQRRRSLATDLRKGRTGSSSSNRSARTASPSDFSVIRGASSSKRHMTVVSTELGDEGGWVSGGDSGRSWPTTVAGVRGEESLGGRPSRNSAKTRETTRSFGPPSDDRRRLSPDIPDVTVSVAANPRVIGGSGSEGTGSHPSGRSQRAAPHDAHFVAVTGLRPPQYLHRTSTDCCTMVCWTRTGWMRGGGTAGSVVG